MGKLWVSHKKAIADNHDNGHRQLNTLNEILFLGQFLGHSTVGAWHCHAPTSGQHRLANSLWL